MSFMKKQLVSVLTLLSAVTVLISDASAQTPPPAAGAGEHRSPIFAPMEKIQPIAQNLYQVHGRGGETLVWVYSKGVVIVDSKLPQSGQKLTELIRTVTNKPITHIINTHAHGDHIGSNPEFAGIEIVAHENAKKFMMNLDKFKTDEGKLGLPNHTFKDRLTLLEGKDAIDLYYFGPSHTDGDALVVFRSARVMHAGDVFKKKELPTIDPEAGGSGVQFAATLAKAVAEIKNVDRIVGGHSDEIMSWQDFVRYAELSRLLLAHERAAFAAGKSAEQTLADFHPPQEFQDFTLVGSTFGGVSAVQTTFNELKALEGRAQ